MLRSMSVLALHLSEKVGLIELLFNSEKPLHLKPGLAVAHNNLAYCYYLKGDYQQALKYLDKALLGGYPVPQQLLEGLEPYRQ